MSKRKSIYMKLIVPVICIMIAQSLLIGLVLFVNGTIRSLRTGSIETMRKNNENNSITLENMMVHNWSNLERYESDVVSVISEYSASQGITPAEAVASYDHVYMLMNLLAENTLTSLRLTSATGVFLYFIDKPIIAQQDLTFRGMYFRDLDPVSTPADYSDIIFLKGPVEISRNYKLQLDSAWNTTFRFSPEFDDLWNSFYTPYSAALSEPTLASIDLSYWSRPHLINPDTVIDANYCITYTRPIIIDGTIVAIIGTEVQVKHLANYYHPYDSGTSAQSGYMLINYSATEDITKTLTGSIYHITGSYINLMLSGIEQTVLNYNSNDMVYVFDDPNLEKSQIVVQPLKLYNSNAPFCNDQWALAAIGTDRVLFEASDNVQTGILYSTGIAFVLGTVVLAYIIRTLIKPLTDIVKQIEENSPDEPITITKENTYEISALYHTLNEMKAKRRDMDIALNEERERYLIALESTTDTFVEYDLSEDVLSLYYFVKDSHASEPSVIIAKSFIKNLSGGKYVHRDDIPRIRQVLKNFDNDTIEMRVKAQYFSHMPATEPMDGYYWLSFKLSFIGDNNGKVKRVIGNARQITDEKRREFALLEANRRDITTGLYNSDYGISYLENLIHKFDAYQLLYVRFENFSTLEAHYGRTFAALIQRSFCRKLLEFYDESITAIRIDNDEAAFFVGGDIDPHKLIDDALSCVSLIYIGENEDMRLKLSFGVAGAETSPQNAAMLLRSAALAALKSSKTGVPMLYSQLNETDKSIMKCGSDRPISVFLDVSKENILALTFELLESTSDTRSAIELLIELIGELYSLNRVIICDYDTDFDSNLLSYQWNNDCSCIWHDKVEKVTRKDFVDLDNMLNSNGTLFYNDFSVRKYSQGVKTLLCVCEGEVFSGYCCILYENGFHTGRILYVSSDRNKIWSDTETYALNEVSKIISAHINIEKSHSASKAKSEFLSRMSHEIRTPMNAIIGMTNIAKERIDNREQLLDSLSKIDFSAKHLLELINDILDISKIESGKLKIESRAFSLCNFIQNIEILMRSPIEDKGITFTVDYNVINNSVRGDEYRLRQVLVNLLGNALKFTDPGGSIVFTIKELDSNDSNASYLMSVRDSGIGIAPDEQLLVFKAFEQSNTGLAQKGGTGLGLAISNSIISAMGSKIELKSQVNEGSDFYFVITLDRDETSYGGENTSDDQPVKRFDGKHALLVDDNEINLEISQFVLENIGFTVDIASNGQEAVDKFLGSAPGTYDIIFMDIQMPVMDGLTATRIIRKNQDHPDARSVYIVAMTANAFNEDMRLSIESGMNGHASKPIDVNHLYKMLGNILK